MSERKVDKNSSYQVLARKYRPSTFSDLVGQDIMVRVLENSFLSKRIAHAFMLTGVRGVGKTTTARIVAKGLNCIGPDGLSGPTISPCGECQVCTSIAKGSHVDVLEVDAASRTGVGDIREIIDSVRYRAASARFKIYIIDEVHMLSISAFNALLKTLEEPPDHVKFIFATTEIKKVPMTILSRCQRFDLKRIEPDRMVEYLNGISSKEGFSIGTDCLGQIARASEGSARDALSLLEQILVDSDGNIDLEKVRSILGLSDRGRILDLFESLVSGDIVGALENFNNMHNEGGDPLGLIKELSEVTHWITVTKVSPELINDVTISPDERLRGLTFSKELSIPFLAKLWQLLLKVMEETSLAVDPKMTAEMGLIRAAYASDLPTPEEVIKSIPSEKNDYSDRDTVTSSKENKTPTVNFESSIRKDYNDIEVKKDGPAAKRTEIIKVSNRESGFDSLPKNFEELVNLIRTRREVDLLIEVEDNLRLVNYQIGRIEFEPTENAATNLASRLNTFLKECTGDRWVVSVVSTGGGKTLREDKQEKKMKQERELIKHPVVAAVFDFFPNAIIEDIRPQTRANTILDEDREDKLWNDLPKPVKKE